MDAKETLLTRATAPNMALNVTRYYLAESTFKGYRHSYLKISYGGVHRVLVS